MAYIVYCVILLRLVCCCGLFVPSGCLSCLKRPGLICPDDQRVDGRKTGQHDDQAGPHGETGRYEQTACLT